MLRCSGVCIISWFFYAGYWVVCFLCFSIIVISYETIKIYLSHLNCCVLQHSKLGNMLSFLRIGFHDPIQCIKSTVFFQFKATDIISNLLTDCIEHYINFVYYCCYYYFDLYRIVFVVYVVKIASFMLIALLGLIMSGLKPKNTKQSK